MSDSASFDTKVIDKPLIVGWLAALLSGDYEKGKGALRRAAGGGSKFCQEGVLADQAARHRGYFWRGETPKAYCEGAGTFGVATRAERKYAPRTTHVPPSLARKAGLHVWVAKNEIEEVCRPGAIDFDTLSTRAGTLGCRLGPILRQINDQTERSLPEMAEVARDFYTGALGLDLPPLGELERLGQEEPEESVSAEGGSGDMNTKSHPYTTLQPAQPTI